MPTLYSSVTTAVIRMDTAAMPFTSREVKGRCCSLVEQRKKTPRRRAFSLPGVSGTVSALSEKGDRNETRPRPRVYPDRAASCHCYHRHPGGDPLPGLRPGPGEVAAGCLSVEHEAAR